MNLDRKGLCPIHRANWQRERYKDPVIRLDRINRTRERRGMPRVQSLAEVRLRGVEA